MKDKIIAESDDFYISAEHNADTRIKAYATESSRIYISDNSGDTELDVSMIPTDNYQPEGCYYSKAHIAALKNLLEKLGASEDYDDSYFVKNGYYFE